jgi:hypothetical protein
MANVTPTKREPLENFGNVYEAQVFVAANGSVDLLKKATTLEVAPVESGPKRSPRSAPGFTRSSIISDDCRAPWARAGTVSGSRLAILLACRPFDC